VVLIGVLTFSLFFSQDLTHQNLLLVRENKALRAELGLLQQALDPDEVTVSLLIVYSLLSLVFWAGRMWWYRHKPGTVYPPDRYLCLPVDQLLEPLKICGGICSSPYFKQSSPNQEKKFLIAV